MTPLGPEISNRGSPVGNCVSPYISPSPCHPSLSSERGRQQCCWHPSRQKPDNVATCGCSGVLCVVLCGTPRAELAWQLLSITPDTRENSDECTTGRAQGTSGWRVNRISSALPPSFCLTATPSAIQSTPFPHPEFLLFRITPSAWTSLTMYVQVNSQPRLRTRLCIILSLRLWKQASLCSPLTVYSDAMTGIADYWISGLLLLQALTLETRRFSWEWGGW